MITRRLLAAVAGERGFAIPVAIFVIVIVSLLALTGLYVAQNNADANKGLRRSWKAFYAANAGAARVLATWDKKTYRPLEPGGGHSSEWLDLPDGSQYQTAVLRVDNDVTGRSTLYRLRTTGRPGHGISAQRVINMMVRVNRADALCCDGALKVQGNLRIQGTGSGVKVSGADSIPPTWVGQCSGATSDVPGVLVQDDDDVRINGRPEIEGSPPLQEDGSIQDQDFTQFDDISYDDLVAVANKRYEGNQTFTNLSPVTSGGNCVEGASFNWGDPLIPNAPCWDYLPIIHVSGDVHVSGNGYGQGILLVDGDLIVTGEFEFYGVVVVQGSADFRGTTDIHGGILVRNGINADSQSFLRGGTTLQYSSCATAKALTEALVARPLDGRHWFEVME